MSLMEQISEGNEGAIFNFLLELTRQQLDPKAIHEMALGQSRSLQSEMRALALKQRECDDSEKTPFKLSSSLGMKTPSPKSDSTRFPANRSVSKNSFSPEAEKRLSNDSQMMPFSFPRTLAEELDYSKMTRGTHNEMLTNAKRSAFINLKAPFALKHETIEDDEEDQTNTVTHFNLSGPIKFYSKFMRWVGSSIYTNMPERIMLDFDKLLRDGHILKVKVVKALNEERPVSYDYNPKKSRTRVSYTDPQDADDRTRNNIASRRSRQRKKFQLQVLQYAVDYDTDENLLNAKHIAWLNTIINNVQLRLVSDSDSALTTIKHLRGQCGIK